MRTVFADTFYWIAFADPKDAWRQAALNARASLGTVELVTTEEVLVEFLSALSRGTSMSAVSQRAWFIGLSRRLRCVYCRRLMILLSKG